MTRRILLDSEDQFVIMRGKAGIGRFGKQNFSISHKGLLNIGHLLQCNISRFLIRSFTEADICSQFGKLLNIIRCPGEVRSEEHTSELQSRGHLVCRLLLAKKSKCGWCISHKQGREKEATKLNRQNI